MNLILPGVVDLCEFGTQLMHWLFNGPEQFSHVILHIEHKVIPES